MKLECTNCGHIFECEDIPEQCPVCQTGEKDRGSNCPNCGFEIVEETDNNPPIDSDPNPDDSIPQVEIIDADTDGCAGSLPEGASDPAAAS